MFKWTSKIEEKGLILFPEFSGARVMMLPFRLDDLDTLPVAHYRPAVRQLLNVCTVKTGVAYLTIDEAFVRAGETHRRPGMHVDGLGGWGGGGGGWARNGMLLASSIFGCRGWAQAFEGEIGPNGECEHLAGQCGPETKMLPNRVYWCNDLAVHESVPQSFDAPRQFIRLSMPSNAPWYEGYTRNPAVAPTGPILPARTQFMSWRTHA